MGFRLPANWERRVDSAIATAGDAFRGYAGRERDSWDWVFPRTPLEKIVHERVKQRAGSGPVSHIVEQVGWGRLDGWLLLPELEIVSIQDATGQWVRKQKRDPALTFYRKHKAEIHGLLDSKVKSSGKPVSELIEFWDWEDPEYRGDPKKRKEGQQRRLVTFALREMVKRLWDRALRR